MTAVAICSSRNSSLHVPAKREQRHRHHGSFGNTKHVDGRHEGTSGEARTGSSYAGTYKEKVRKERPNENKKHVDYIVTQRLRKRSFLQEASQELSLDSCDSISMIVIEHLEGPGNQGVGISQLVDS
jgi:hypothetical protein